MAAHGGFGFEIFKLKPHRAQIILFEKIRIICRQPVGLAFNQRLDPPGKVLRVRRRGIAGKLCHMAIFLVQYAWRSWKIGPFMVGLKPLTGFYPDNKAAFFITISLTGPMRSSDRRMDGPDMDIPAMTSP